MIIVVFTLGEASAAFMEFVFRQQCQDALPHLAPSIRSGGQKNVHLHSRVNMPVLQNSDLQRERTLLKLINWLKGFQTLTYTNQTCRSITTNFRQSSETGGVGALGIN